jgi:hypothetical protein
MRQQPKLVDRGKRSESESLALPTCTNLKGLANLETTLTVKALPVPSKWQGF